MAEVIRENQSGCGDRRGKPREERDPAGHESPGRPVSACEVDILAAVARRIRMSLALLSRGLQAAKLPSTEPLFDAIRRADAVAVKRLLDRGADANAAIEFLLKNQYEDGSWFVKTRSFPVQPQFESGYPFGYNQWISSAGASWASLAIAYTLPRN